MTFHLPVAEPCKEQLVTVIPGIRALKLPYQNDGGGARHAAFYMLLLLPDGA